MVADDILRLRLRNQHLARQSFDDPAGLVRWLGAVQAQDYAGAKWAVGQRIRHATDAVVEAAVAEGTILRTHVMRPTWHFVARDDIRWLLALTSARIKAVLASYDRQLGIDAPTIALSRRAIERALSGGGMLTRTEVGAVLQDAGIPAAETVRLGRLLAHAELDGVICSGAPRGDHQTYALLDLRAPAARSLERDQALAELATRYFTSHGPATLRDYVWWSGLKVSDAKRGMDIISGRLTKREVEGRTHFWLQGARMSSSIRSLVRLLPNFDEYVVAYADRRALCNEPSRPDPRASFLLSPTVAIDGRVQGTWRRAWTKDGVIVSITPASRFPAAVRPLIEEAVQRYSRFLGRPMTVRFLPSRRAR